MTDSDRRLPAELALLGVCLIWGCNFSVKKYAQQDLHPMAINAIRLTLSVAFLWLAHSVTGGRRRPLPRGARRRVLALGLLGHFAYQVLFLSGLAHTGSGNAALILASAPVFTFLLGSMLGERLGWISWGGMVIAFTGMVVIALAQGVEVETGQLWGSVMVFGAAGAWGCYTVLNRGMSQTIPATTLALYSMAMVLPLHWLLGAPHLAPLWTWQLSASVWAALFYSGVLGTGLALIFFNLGLRGAGASYTAGVISLVPVVALLMGALVLDEAVTLVQVVGGACVLGGVAILRRARAVEQRLGDPGSKPS